MRLVSLLVCVLLVGGCIKSINPVLKDEQVREYPQLAGKWVGSDDSKTQLEVKADGKRLLVTLVDEDGRTGEYIVRVGVVGDLTIAEFKPADLPEDANVPSQVQQMVPVYSFAVLTEMQPAIRARTFKPDTLPDYGKAHPDELPMAGRGDSELIVASTEQLQAVILKLWAAESASSDEIVFVRPAAERK